MAITFDADGEPIAVGPAIELSVWISRAEDMTPGNVTLCNLGADQFIRGEMTDWDSFDFEALSTLEITATRDGETLLTTTPMDSLGGPRSAHEWCMAKAKALGYALPKAAFYSLALMAQH